MKTKKFLQKLEKKRIITKQPKPIYPFLLGIISLVFWVVIFQTSGSNDYDQFLTNLLLILTIFTFVFAIIHWWVVKVLESK